MTTTKTAKTTAARARVFAALWQDTYYRELHASKDRHAAFLRRCEAIRGCAETPAAERRHREAVQRICRYEDLALRRAGLMK